MISYLYIFLDVSYDLYIFLNVTKCFAGQIVDIPSQNEALNQCWFNVGPPSATLVQH